MSYVGNGQKRSAVRGSASSHTTRSAAILGSIASRIWNADSVTLSMALIWSVVFSSSSAAASIWSRSEESFVIVPVSYFAGSDGRIVRLAASVSVSSFV